MSDPKLEAEIRKAFLALVAPVCVLGPMEHLWWESWVITRTVRRVIQTDRERLIDEVRD